MGPPAPHHALADVVRALRQAGTGAEVERLVSAFAATDAPTDAVAIVADVATLARSRLRAVAEARRDSLTGVLNRRGFFESAQARIAACPGPVALVVVDVDGLKAINDRHGHDEGSATLRATGDVLQAAFGDAVVGRLGGDEFGVLVLDRSDTDVLARRLEAARSSRGALGDVRRLELSAGFATGIATAPHHLDALLTAADAGLYAGRDRRRTDHGRFARVGPGAAVRALARAAS